MKAWYCVCILICLYSIHILIDESYEVVYISADGGVEPVSYLACFGLRRFYPNQSELLLERLQTDLYEYFENYENSWRRREPRKYEELILKRISSMNYLVWADLVCLRLNNQRQTSSVLLFFQHETLMLAFNENTFDLIHLKHTHFEVSQLIVINRAHPYSNCLVDSSRFHCLNDCFKKRKRLSKYLYDGNETGLVRLPARPEDELTERGEQACFSQCDRENCKLIYFSIAPSVKLIEHAPKIFKALPLVSEFEYLFQLVGLLCLILSISFYQSFSALIKLIRSKAQRSEISSFRSKNIWLFLELIVVLLCFVIFVYLNAQMIIAYEHKKANPIRKETTVKLVEPEPLRVVICFDLAKNAAYYLNTTALEIEKESNSRIENIEAIFLEFQNKQTKLNYTLQRLVAFDGLNRCFQLAIAPVEPRYQSLLAISKLTIKFKRSIPYVRFYLLADEESFSTGSFRYTGFNSFFKNISKRTTGCVDRKQAYPDCGSRWRCIDRCASRRSLKIYRNITIGFDYVVRKEDYSEQEWRQAYLVYDRNTKNIRQDCTNAFAELKLCNENKFEQSIVINSVKENTISLDLYYSVISSVLEDNPSGYKLLLDILSAQSILFGLTVFKLLMSTYRFIQTALPVALPVRSNETLNGHHKLSLLFVYLFCAFGFSWHTYRIFDLVINGPLTYSQHHKLADRIAMPEIVLCFQIDTSRIDAKRNLTGRYLEQLTSQMVPESIFRDISFLTDRWANGSKWITLRGAADFKSRSNFKILTFFFLDCKCFSVWLNQVYRRDQFHFSTNTEVLRINFLNAAPVKNLRMYHSRQDIIHLMTKTREKMEFSQIMKFVMDFRAKRLSISQELQEIHYHDKAIKNPLSLFSGAYDANDVNLFFRRLLSGFRRTHQKVTRNLPIKRDLFDYEIDDRLFERYFNETQTGARPTNFNNRREFAINHSKYEAKLAEQHDFVFSLIYLKKVILATNDDSLSYAKFILNLLNVLSIWFGLGVLNLPVYLANIRRLFALLGRSSARPGKFSIESQLRIERIQ